MTPMKPAQRKRIEKLDRMKRCEREGPDCSQTLSWEHPWARLIGGKHVPDSCVICLCTYHHGLVGNGGLDKQMNKAIAYKYITEGELDGFRTTPSRQERKYLWAKYPQYARQSDS